MRQEELREARCRFERFLEPLLPLMGRSERRKWGLGLAMIDRARGWGMPEGVIVTDAGYGVATEFRQQLQARDLLYAVGITGDVCMWQGRVMPEPVSYQGFGRPRKGKMPETKTAAGIAKSLPESAWSDIVWREGTKGPMQVASRQCGFGPPTHMLMARTWSR